MTRSLNAENCTSVESNSELQDAVLAEISRVKENDPLAPVTLLVPSHSLAWQIRRQLARRMHAGSALVGVRAVTDLEFLDQCALALELQPASGGDRIVRAAVLENGLRRAGGVLGVSADHPETALRLGRAMDDLQWCALNESDIDALPNVASPTSVSAIGFIRGVRSEVSETTGSANLVVLSEQIVSAVNSRPEVPAGISAFGTIILISQDLPSPVWSVLVNVGLPVYQIKIEQELRAIKSQIHGVPDPATEVAVAARYVAQAIDEGIDPERIAVIYSTPIPYAGLLDHAFTDAQIAWHGPTPYSLRETVLARRVDILLEMAEHFRKGNGLPRTAFMRWLALEPARTSDEDPRAANLRNLIRSEGLFGDARQWSRGLSELQLLAETAYDPEDSDSRARKRQQTALQAGHLNALITELVEFLQSLTDANSWVDIARVLQAAINRYSPSSATPRSAAEASAKSLLTDLLQSSLPLIDSMINTQTSRHLRPAPDTLRALLDRELDQVRATHGDAATGIHIGTVASTRGLTFDAVVIVGAADGLLPSVRNTNPLINDATRKTLRVNPADSLTVVELEERNRRDLLAAIAGSRILAVTFPRGAIPDSGVSKVSRYFTSDQSNDRTSYKSFQHALGNGPNPITDIDMAIVLGSGADNVAQELEHIVQSFQSWARPGFTENFGNFGEGEATWDLGGVPLSASAIESYLHCPYGFFVNRVLGFSTDTFDDEVEEISSKDLGLLLHEALEDLVTSARDNGWLPAPGEPWSDTAPHQAIEIFRAKATDAELKGLTGWKPAWESVRQEIVEAIPQFLEVDSAMRSEPPMSPGQAELGFGFDGAPFAEIETSRNTTVQLRGAIDRLDLSPDGTSARVVDYKSGKANNFSKALRDREKIQDLVYSAAVRALLPKVRDALVTFLFVPNQGDVVTIDAAFERDPFEELVEILDRLETSSITGSFPPKYSGSRDYCPVCSILGRRANRIDNHSKEIAEKDSPLLMTSTDGAPNDK